MPDDGRRYEVVDGTLFVSPVPGTKHQMTTYRLFGVLDAACPAELCVVGGPYSLRPSHTTELHPDLLVGRAEDFTDRLLPTTPLLVVEVLSPSTALNDVYTKKAVYERLGVPSYWVIDPESPSVRFYEMDMKGRYQLSMKISGWGTFHARRPFPVRIVPMELLGRLVGYNEVTVPGEPLTITA
jgi:Uma2 family endonuclease